MTGLTNYSSAEDCTRLREGYGYVVQYNHTCLHVAPLYQTLADQALVRYAVNNSDFKITTSISPLPITSLEEGLGESEDVFNAWFLVVLSFPFIAGAYASFVVVERESKAKHLQTVAGVEPTAYWLSTFLWDVVNYQIPMWLIVASMFIFQVDAMTTSKNDVFSGILAVLFLYGPASAGYSYCWSFAFTSPSVCNVFLIVTGFIVGFGGPLTIFILLILSANPNDPDDNLKTVAKILTWVLRFSPSFCLGKGIFFATNISFFTAIEGDPALSVWTEPVLLFEVIFLFTQGVGYIILAILLDIWSSRPHLMSRWNRTLHFLTCGCSSGHHNSEITTALPEDDDVVAEQDRVNSGDANSDLIVLSQLSKVFSNGKVAVNNLSLGIPHGECFGLVGINGTLISNPYFAKPTFTEHCLFTSQSQGQERQPQ